ncbi:MAG: DUF3375 domain-containing protein [Desulfobulbaceae bacterium]|nr:DUF3375 domain-containing protein [Desulfobulbaceae bacterium]
MDHDYLLELKRSHPALRLLAADTAPLVLGFLFRVFVKPNRRGIGHGELESLLNDYLFGLHRIHGEEHYPRTGGQYLEVWADPGRGILRKYYPDRGDEPEFDLTPATAQAIDWIQGLQERQFVGTESRLRIILDLLREIIQETEQDPKAVIHDLEVQKQEIENKIASIQEHGLSPTDPTRIREQFFQAEETARRLLADFRQVEYNFRNLDGETRELTATSDKSKGALLDEIFTNRDVIRDSDQGRSFQGFWELLMTPARQTELQEMLARLYQLEEILALHPDPFLKKIHFSLLEAGERVYKTANRLVEQLRRFLDDQAWLENRRIMDLIKIIEKQAIEIKDSMPADRDFIRVPQLKPRLELPMSRNLFSPPRSIRLESAEIEEGTTDITADLLYEQIYVDEQLLRNRINRLLQTRSQISLTQLLEQHPLERGLAELVAYVNIGTKEGIVDEEQQLVITIILEGGTSRRIWMPRVLFVR